MRRGRGTKVENVTYGDTRYDALGAEVAHYVLCLRIFVDITGKVSKGK